MRPFLRAGHHVIGLPGHLPPARTLPLATPADLDDAVTVIRALIRTAATA